MSMENILHFAALLPTLDGAQNLLIAKRQERLKEAGAIQIRRHRYTAEDWEKYKQIIECLYLTEKKSWKAVLDILQNEYNFRITRRQFFKKVDEWKLYKNVKHGEMRKLDREQRHQCIVAGQSSPIMLHGRNVRYDKLERWRTKHQMKDSKAHENVVNNDHVMEDVVHSTATTQTDATIELASFRELKPSITRSKIARSFHKSVNYSSTAVTDGIHHGMYLDIETKLSWLFNSLQIHYDMMSINFKTIPRLGASRNLCTLKSVEKEETFMGHNSTVTDPRSDTLPLRHSAIVIPNISQEMKGFWSVDLAIRMFEELSPFPKMYLPEKSHQENFRRRLLSLKQKFDDLTREGGPEETLGTMSSLAYEFSQQGDYEKAVKLYGYIANAKKKKYGAEDPKTLWAYVDLIHVYIDQGRYTLAEKLQKPVEAASSQMNPQSSLAIEIASTTAVIMFYQCRDQIFNKSLRKRKYAEVERLQRDILQLTLNKLGPSHPRTLKAMDHLACTLESRDRIRAVKLRCIIVELMLLERSRWEASSYRHAYNSMAVLLLGAERQVEERTNLKVAVFEETKLLFGSMHPETLGAAQRLGTTYYNQDLIPQSETIFQQNFKNCVQILGATHPRTLKSLVYLAMISLNSGEVEKGLRYAKKFLDGDKTTLGHYHRQLLLECEDQGRALQKQKRFDEALLCHMLVMERLNHAKDSEEHAWYLSCCSDVGRCYRKTFRYKDAARYYEEELKGREIISGLSEEITLQCIVALGICYEKQGLYKVARDLFQRVVTYYTLTKGTDNDVVKEYQDSISNLGSIEIRSCIKVGSAYVSDGKYHDAILFYEDALERMMWKGEEHPDIERLEKAIDGAVMMHCNDLGRFYEFQGRYLDAITVYERAIDEFYSRGNDESHLDVQELRFRIDKVELKNCEIQGGEYEKQGRYGEALSLYESTLAKHENFQTREHHDLQLLRQCVSRVQDFLWGGDFEYDMGVIHSGWVYDGTMEIMYGYVDDTVIEENLEAWTHFEEI